MRCEAIGRAVALAVALIMTGCAPELCSRSSDCTGGLVCTQAGACAVPVDTSGDAGTDGGSRDAATDASSDAAGDAAADAGELIDAQVAAPPRHDRRPSRIWRKR